MHLSKDRSDTLILIASKKNFEVAFPSHENRRVGGRMAYLDRIASGVRTYGRDSEVQFSDQNGLFVKIETKRLKIRSVQNTEADLERYIALFGDKVVMEKAGIGKAKTRDEVQKNVKDWLQGWRENNPFNGLAVFHKETDSFVGHLILKPGDSPGQAEFAGVGHQNFWVKGYGTEAAKAIVHEYAPAIVREGYHCNGKPLEEIFATARVDNPASSRILEKMGMYFTDQRERYGAQRKFYRIRKEDWGATLKTTKNKSREEVLGYCCPISTSSQALTLGTVSMVAYLGLQYLGCKNLMGFRK